MREIYRGAVFGILGGVIIGAAAANFFRNQDSPTDNEQVIIAIAARLNKIDSDIESISSQKYDTKLKEIVETALSEYGIRQDILRISEKISKIESGQYGGASSHENCTVSATSHQVHGTSTSNIFGTIRCAWR